MNDLAGCVPSLDALVIESLPNEYKGLARLQPRSRPVKWQRRTMSGPDWDAWAGYEPLARSDCGHTR